MKRRFFSEIWSWIESPEILFLIGPRQVGKTTLLEQIKERVEQEKKGKTYFYTFEDFSFLQACNTDPKNLLWDIGDIKKGEKVYVFLDEVQYLDDPSRFLKYIFDTKKESIKLVISGSSSFYLDDRFRDSLAGRKIIFPITPLSFSEFLQFRQKKVFPEFSDMPDFRRTEYFSLLEEYAIFGGYPRVVLEPEVEKKKRLLQELVFSFLKKDVLEQNIRKQDKFYDFLRILSDQYGQMYNKQEIGKLLQISSPTVEEYGSILQKTFMIDLLKPFHKKVNKEIKKMPKIFFHDSGIRNLLTKNFEKFESRSDRGELFEQLCFQILRDQEDELFFWRTQAGQEIDFIIPGKKQALEVKFNIRKLGKEKHRKSFLSSYPEFSYREISSENIWDFL